MELNEGKGNPTEILGMRRQTRRKLCVANVILWFKFGVFRENKSEYFNQSVLFHAGKLIFTSTCRRMDRQQVSLNVSQPFTFLSFFSPRPSL